VAVGLEAEVVVVLVVEATELVVLVVEVVEPRRVLEEVLLVEGVDTELLLTGGLFWRNGRTQYAVPTTSEPVHWLAVMDGFIITRRSRPRL
jgi:hypothetical protein